MSVVISGLPVCVRLVPRNINPLHITEDFRRKVVMIRCLPYNQSHTGESIKSRLLFVLDSWGLGRDEVHCILSNSAANMKKAFEDLNWIACFLHILALAVKHSVLQYLFRVV